MHPDGRTPDIRYFFLTVDHGRILVELAVGHHGVHDAVHLDIAHSPANTLCCRSLVRLQIGIRYGRDFLDIH